MLCCNRSQLLTKCVHNRHKLDMECCPISERLGPPFAHQLTSLLHTQWCATMLALVKAHSDFIDAASKSIDDGTRIAALKEDHGNQLLRSLATLVGRVPLEDSTIALSFVQSSSFSAEMKAKITNVIIGCSSAIAHNKHESDKVALKPQTHFWIHRYLTEQDWDVLTNKSVAYGVKIDTLVRRCTRIGLLSLTEQTAKALTSVLIVAHGEPCELPECYDSLMKVKAAFKKMQKHRAPGSSQTMKEFPSDVRAFLDAWPDAYTPDCQPVASKVDDKAIEELRVAIPLRQTNGALGTKSQLAAIVPSMARSNSAQAVALQWLMPIAQALSQQQTQQSRTPKRKASMLALCDGGLDDSQHGDETPRGTPRESPTPSDVHGGLNDSQGDGGAGASNVHDAPPRGTPAGENDASSVPSAVAESVKAVQAALALKAGLKKGAEEDEMDTAKSEANDKATGKQKGSGKSKAKAKAKSKSAAKAKAKSKATIAASKPSMAAGAHKRPPMPPRKKMAPIKYLTCSVYSSEKDRKWRAISSANKRYDVSFAWKGGQESWDRCMAWCEENTE